MSASQQARAAFAAVAAVVSCLAAPVASAEPLERSPVVLRSGDWAVHRTQDSMTDASICTAIYRDDSAIQLGSHSLTIAVADGPKNVTLRFDGEKAHDARLPKHSERAISAINIEGADFDRMLRSRRLRYRVLTGTDALVEGDVDLTGAIDTYKNIQSGCVGDPLPER